MTPTSHMAEALSRERVVMWRTQTRRLAAADGEIERASDVLDSSALEDDEPKMGRSCNITTGAVLTTPVVSGFVLLFIGLFLISGGLDSAPWTEPMSAAGDAVPHEQHDTQEQRMSPPAPAAPGICFTAWRAYNVTDKDEKEQGTSDPQLRMYEGTALAEKCMSIYVRHCLSHARLVGRTGVLYENLSPTWPDTFCLARSGHRAQNPLHLCFEVRDDWPPVQEYLLNAGCVVYTGPGPYVVELTDWALLTFLVTDSAPPAPPSSVSPLPDTTAGAER